MKRSARYLALVAVMGSLAARAEDAPKATAPAAEWSVLPHLPAGTLGVLTIRDVQAAREKSARTGLGQLVNAPQAREFLAGPLLAARGRLLLIEQQWGFKLNEVLQSFQGEVTLAVLGFLETRTEKGERVPDLLVAFQPRGQAEAWSNVWQRFLDQVNAQSGGQLQVRQSQFGGTDVFTLSLPGSVLQVCYASRDGMFLLGLNQGRVEGVLAAHAVAGAAAPAGPPAAALTANPLYQRARGQCGPDADVLVFVNLEEMRKLPEYLQSPGVQKEQPQLEQAGLNDVGAVAYGLSFEETGLRETAFLDCPARARKGLLALMDAPPLAAQALSVAPPDAVAALAWQTDPAQLLDRIAALAAPADAEARARFDTALNALSQALNMDVRRDLLGALTGQLVFSVALPAKDPKLGFGFPAPLLKLGLKDRATLLKALIAFRRTAQEKWQFTDLVHGDQTITVARELVVEGGRNPGQFCWTIIADQLVLSLFPLALRDELDRLAAQVQGTAAGLTADAGLRAAREKLGPASQLLLYLDQRAIATAAYDFFVPLGQLDAKFRPRNLDLDVLPPAEVLTAHLTGLGVTLSAGEGGLTARAYSSTGMLAAVAPVVAAIVHARRQAARAAARPPAPDQPAEPAPGAKPATPPPDF